MASVTFSHVTKRFQNVEALKDFDLHVEDQEFLVLVGPSGCGKSTALRLLAGLEQISEGDIYIGERRVNDVAPRERDIAMVFQSYALYPHMSVYDNMAFGLTLRKMPKLETEARVKETARILGIENLLDRKPRQLSGGQRQRVALGRAIVREPVVFLLDEPLSNLDAKLRVQTRTEINKLHQRLKTTFVYVTHDQVEAMTMATRIAVMNLGVIQQVGSPQSLYDSPQNIFVAGFIGSPAMNFFDVKVIAENDEVYLDGGTFKARVPIEKAGALAPYLNKQVVFGIRPENIHDASLVPPRIETASMTAKVDVTELMGNEVFLYLVSADHQFLARVDPRTLARPGKEIELALDMSEMHAFDPDTEQAVLRRDF
jgi:multiple sugar transport system ATP-binding protein